MNYLLKSKGVCCIYLGCSVSIDDVEYVAKLKKPDYLYTHLTSCSSKFNFEKFISNMSKKSAGIPVIISGQLTNTYAKKIVPPVYFKRSFAEVMDFVSGLCLSS
jgi:methanogenic corrinoid protein MtbC1